MTNPFFDFIASVSRFVPRTKAKAEDVNARFDEVTQGFDGVQAALDLKAPLASPTFTGVPRAPTAAVGTDSTQLATTEFVRDEIGVSATIGLPSTAGRSGPLFVEDDIVDWKDGASFLFRLPIFQANAAYTPASAMEMLPVETFATGLPTTGALSSGAYGASLLVVATATAAGNVASSADGETWVLRAMPSSATWVVASDGTSFVAHADGGTATAVSTDGVTWSSGGALPTSGDSVPAVRVGGLWLVVLSTTAYATSSDGAAWTSRSFPATLKATTALLQGTGVVWAKTGASGTVAYTTTDGINWTVRATPFSFDMFTVDPDGALAGTDGTENFHTSTDGATWTDSGIATPLPGVSVMRATLNSVHVVGSSESNGGAYTYNDDRWVRRAAGGFAIDGKNHSVNAFRLRGVLNGAYFGQSTTAGYLRRMKPTAATTALFSAL